jgi:hypothetical protein
VSFRLPLRRKTTETLGFASLYAYFWDLPEWEKGNKKLVRDFKEFEK